MFVLMAVLGNYAFVPPPPAASTVLKVPPAGGGKPAPTPESQPPK
jgi:hypothetical protein